jgi:hypothetical protein
MSTSKKRRKAREWMQTQVEKQKKDLDSLRSSHKRELDRQRDELTMVLAPDDGNTVYPQGRLDQPYMRIAQRPDFFRDASSREFDRFIAHDPNALQHYMIRHYHLRATQHAFVLPCGTKVVWYGWELSR